MMTVSTLGDNIPCAKYAILHEYEAQCQIEDTKHPTLWEVHVPCTNGGAKLY